MGIIGLEMVGEFMDVDKTAREEGISEVAGGAQETQSPGELKGTVRDAGGKRDDHGVNGRVFHRVFTMLVT